MIKVFKSDVFDAWLRALSDRQARTRIADRISRIEEGNLGDHKSVGHGVSELRLSFGPGYRLYFIRHGHTVVVLLCGGDKKSQAKDILKARQLARAWKELNE